MPNFRKYLNQRDNYWLGREGSNLRMAESKSAGLAFVRASATSVMILILYDFRWLMAKLNRLFDVKRFSKNFQAFSMSIIDCRLLHATWSRHEPAPHTKP